MTYSNILLYGAEAAPRPPLSIKERVRFAARRKVHGFLDATRCRQGDLSGLDYRNYEGRDAINQGDVAITQATQALVRQGLSAAEIHGINWGELGQQTVRNEDRQQTALIFNSSGYFHVNSDGRLAARIKDDFNWLLDQQIPAFFLGVGLNRPGQTGLDTPVSLHPADAAVVSQLLDYAQAISVRDAATQAALAALTTKPVHLIGDPALHFCHAMAIAPPSAGIRTAHTPPVIGVNVSFHGKNSTALIKKNLMSYAAALRRLQEKTGATFRYFVHYETENILPRLFAQCGVNIQKVPVKTHRAGAGDTATLAREYAKLDLHIGGMLHSCILATSAGTPCLALAYDIKHQGFFDLMGLPQNCLSAADFDPEALFTRALDLLANPSPVRNHIAARRKVLETETRNFLAQQLKAS